jgi:hypothetical protein
MTKKTLDDQMAQDQEVVAKLDKETKNLYSQELKYVVDRGNENRVAPPNRFIFSY